MAKTGPGKAPSPELQLAAKAVVVASGAIALACLGAYAATLCAPAVADRMGAGMVTFGLAFFFTGILWLWGSARKSKNQLQGCIMFFGGVLLTVLYHFASDFRGDWDLSGCSKVPVIEAPAKPNVQKEPAPLCNGAG